MLSRLPFVNLFYEVVALIAPKYFAGGESVLHNACLDISNWPSLQAGECIRLPLLGIQFETYIPSLTSANLQQPHSLSKSSSSVTLNQENEDLKISSPDSTTSNDAKPSNSAAASADFTTSTSDDDMSSVKNNDNQTSDNDQQTMANKSKETSLSREDILDSYKQSKEMLLAQQLKKQPDSPCDSNSSKSTGANNANNYENENDNNENDGGGGRGGKDNEANVDLEYYFDGNYSDNNKVDESANTHADTSTNIERPLRLQQSKSIKCLSSATEIDIFRSLYTVLSYTHLLWELVLTAEPIVVMGTSPSDCSHMVQSLMR